MERFADMIGITALGILSWQDFRFRKIAWWLLPIIVGALLVCSISKNPAAEIGREFCFNIFFLAVQFFLLWIWFAIRNRKFSKIIDTQIGLGDVLFLICIALAFSPANFLVFYTLTMILTLTAVMISRKFISEMKTEIPLAGALALPLIGLCMWRMVDPSKDFYSDEWLMKLLEGNS